MRKIYGCVAILRLNIDHGNHLVIPVDLDCPLFMFCGPYPKVSYMASRSTGVRPSFKISSRMREGLIPTGTFAPAAWVIFSSMMVPSRSEAPAWRAFMAVSIPICIQARYGHRTQNVFFAGDVRDNFVEGVVFWVVNQGDEGEESGGFVLQVTEHFHVGDAVFGFFDVAKEHGGVGGDSQLVCSSVHRKPFLASFFTWADLVPDALHQDFGAASGESVKACLFQRRHDLLGTLARDF